MVKRVDTTDLMAEAKTEIKTFRGQAATMANTTLDAVTLERVKGLLAKHGGALPFPELQKEVPGVTISKLKTRFAVTFGDGYWVVHLPDEKYQTSFDETLRANINAFLDSTGGFKGVYRVTKKFNIDRNKIRSLGFEVRKELVLSPSFTDEAVLLAEFENPLEEDQLSRLIEALSKAGGVLRYEEVGIAMNCNISKAQLGYHFDIKQFGDGRCEVRIPGVEGTLEELRGDKEPDLVAPLTDEQVEEVTAFLQRNGGSVDAELVRDEFPNIKKHQLRTHFDVECVRKVKETRKRFYSVTIRGNLRAQKSVQLAAERAVRDFLGTDPCPKGQQKGKPPTAGKSQGQKGKGKGKGKGRTWRDEEILGKKSFEDIPIYGEARGGPSYEVRSFEDIPIYGEDPHASNHTYEETSFEDIPMYEEQDDKDKEVEDAFMRGVDYAASMIARGKDPSKAKGKGLRDLTGPSAKRPRLDSFANEKGGKAVHPGKAGKSSGKFTTGCHRHASSKNGEKGGRFK